MNKVGGFLENAVPGMTTVLVIAHGRDCVDCKNYMDQLSTSSEEFRIWDARLIAEEAGTPSVVVADRYGQIFYVTDAGDGHRFPDARELEEWLKYLGTLCPE